MTDGRGTHSIAGFSLPTMAGLVLSLAFIVGAEYPPQALAALIALFFAVYIWMRVMIFLENDRFTPKRLRVGLTWALIGVHDEANEFDARPVRVYFVLLTVLFIGLVLRPLVGAVMS